MSKYELKFFDQISSAKKVLLSKNDFYKSWLQKWKYNSITVDYNMEYFNKSYKNNSLIIYRDNIPILIIPSISCDKNLSWFGHVTEVFENNLSREELNKCYNIIRKFLSNKINLVPNKAFLISNSYIVNDFFNNIINSRIVYKGTIDLTIEKTKIFKNIRKSYKSLINWGIKSFDIVSIDRNNYSLENFLKFKDLHFKASGRETRSKKTWDIQAQMIIENRAFLVLAFDQMKLIAGVFIQHDCNNAFYGVAASDRDIMKEGKSLTHSTLWYAINVAKEKGINLFSFGDISPSDDVKLNNINLFKKGFCTSVETELQLKLTF